MNYKNRIEKLFIFKTVSTAAEELKVQSFIIGGFVRDLLIERPSKDIDIVCLGSGIELAKKVADHLGVKQVVTYNNFGTAMLKYDDLEVEFVGARKESYRKNSRKPIVENGSLEDDQNRRDFTINALAISLNKKNYGELVDPFNGIEDLKSKNIQTPLDPDITFVDDPLRMMRAIRFASQLNFDIAPDTFEAITKNKERIKIVSGERIIDELNKIILSPTPSYGFKLLFHSGLLEIIFPEMVALHGVETIDGKSHKDNFYHTLKVLDNLSEVSDNLWQRWAAILHDIAKPPTKRFDKISGWTFHGHEERGARMTPGIFRRLKLPLNENMKYVKKLVRLHLRPIALVKDNISDSAIRRLIFEAGNDIDDLMALCKADITSKNNEKVKRYIQNFEKLEKRIVEVEEKDSLRNFKPVITGELIMEIFNLKPSKVVGTLKSEVREAILDGIIKNHIDEAIPFLIDSGKKHGLKPVDSFAEKNFNT